VKYLSKTLVEKDTQSFHDNAYWKCNQFARIFYAFHGFVVKLEYQYPMLYPRLLLLRDWCNCQPTLYSGLSFNWYTISLANKTTMISINKVESEAKLKLRETIYTYSPPSYHLRPLLWWHHRMELGNHLFVIWYQCLLCHYTRYSWEHICWHTVRCRYIHTEQFIFLRYLVSTRNR